MLPSVFFLVLHACLAVAYAQNFRLRQAWLEWKDDANRVDKVVIGDIDVSGHSANFKERKPSLHHAVNEAKNLLLVEITSGDQKSVYSRHLVPSSAIPSGSSQLTIGIYLTNDEKDVQSFSLNFNSSSKVHSSRVVVGPELEFRRLAASKTGSANPLPAEGEKSFFQKYWMYILGFGLMFMLGGSPQQQQEQQPTRSRSKSK